MMGGQQIYKNDLPVHVSRYNKIGTVVNKLTFKFTSKINDIIGLAINYYLVTKRSMIYI